MRSNGRSLLASLLILAGGIATLSVATDGFDAFTSEAARRLNVRAQPRAVPDVALQAADGERFRFDELRGRWVLVDFIYTRCTTYCAQQGGVFAELQDLLADPIEESRAALVSVSFDPEYDDPAHLASYQHHAGDRGAGWIAARPTDAAGLAAMNRTFGVTVVPDGLGGFVHNVAIGIVDPQGRLVAILDGDDPASAARYVVDRLGT